jgi:hypothetical protein
MASAANWSVQADGDGEPVRGTDQFLTAAEHTPAMAPTVLDHGFPESAKWFHVRPSASRTAGKEIRTATVGPPAPAYRPP